MRDASAARSCSASGSKTSRAHTLPHATAQTRPILGTARELLAATMPLIARRGVTLVGLSVANLENDTAVQPPLPFERNDEVALDAALDEVRRRYGTNAVVRAVLLDRDEGITMPMLPD